MAADTQATDDAAQSRANTIAAPRRVRVALRTKIAVAMIVISALSLLSLTVYMYRGVDLLTQRDLSRMSRELGVTATRLGTEIDVYRKDTLFLARTPPIMGIHGAETAGGVDPLDGSTDDLWLDRLSTIFIALLDARPEYLQARYIGVAGAGRELVRVDRLASGEIVRISSELLQSKGSRPYFAEASWLEEGDIYYSKIDLNQEFGQIEVPHRPVLRTATPVRDEAGDLLGIVVINIDFRFLLNMTNTAVPDDRFYVANAQGDYLSHPDGSHAFGFDLGQRYLLQDEFPAFAGIVDESSNAFSGLVELRDGEHLAVAEAVDYGHVEGGERLILAMVADRPGLPAQARDLRNGAVAAGSILMLLSIVAIVWLVDLIVRPLAGMTQLAKAVAAGNRTIDTTFYSRRSDEIGDLARSFTAMTGEVAKRENELIRQKNALHESEMLFRETVEFAPDALIIVDEEGRIILANSAVESIFGYRQAELLGQCVDLLVPEASRDSHRMMRATYNKAPTRRNMLSGLEIFGQTKNGDLLPVEVSIGPAVLQGRKATLAIIRDISESREVERKLSTYARELERSNAELMQFAYVASHDLQEPLRMVDSYVNLLARRYKGKLDEEADEFIGFATDGARRMKLLINDLLSYSRVSNRPLSVESVDVGMVVDNACRMLADKISETDAEINVGDMPTLDADPGQLERLFVNLVGNAVKYCGEERPRIDIAAEKKGEGYEFTIADNGIGIEPQFRDKVFEIFTRLHRRDDKEGTGIGLASCKRIVERHGGNIWLEDSETGGIAVHFTLPAHEDGA